MAEPHLCSFLVTLDLISVSLMAKSRMSNSGPHNSDPGGSMFREASDIHIHGGTFNAYGSGVMDEKKRIADAMVLLASHAEPGAPYDAAAREDVPKCHERTRLAIIEGIHKWAHSDPRPLMWMYGPAGSGKTTIMQTVAEIFDKEGSLATSFFFSRLSAARPREKKNFVTTIAHQLSLCMPDLKPHLADALSDTSILAKSLAKQLDALVVGPLNMLDPVQIGSPCIFLVDGLDECDGDTAQRDILDLLERLLEQTSHCVRILVASRSLSHIQAFFSRGRIGHITQTIPLDNDYQSDNDVMEFLISEFAKIRDEHPARGELPSEWPFCADIGVLVGRASGQFIYATVVMKFIGDHGRHPDESLQTIIGLKVDSNARPYEELDAVYAQVLSTIEPQNVKFVQTLLGCLLLDKERFHYAHVAQTKATKIVDLLFMNQPGTTDARINRIYPLITASSKLKGGLQFSHASFPEYLLDCSRSKEFFLDMRKVHCDLALFWFKAYTAHLKVDPHGATNIPGYEWDNRTATNQKNGLFGDVICHCLEGEWTSELRQDVLSFDVHAAFDARCYSGSRRKVYWVDVVLWLDFITWIEQHHLLSSAETEHIRGCIHKTIQSVVSSEPLIYANSLKVIAGLLTCYKHVDTRICWLETRDVSSLDEGRGLAYEVMDRIMIFEDRIREASYLWLFKAMAIDLEINGSFFADGNLYAGLALLYAQAQVKRNFYSETGQWKANLAFMLSKASPSEELAKFLVQHFIQLPRVRFFQEKTKSQVEGFFRAIVIYLFECGIPFISEHQHKPEFDSFNWVCGICLLFDPSKEEPANIELSRDPVGKPGLHHVHIAKEGVAQLNLVRPLLPRALLPWLQTWIFWLAELITRFFPVVA
ncbi:hypothetical protein D9619_004603 [Psilocybe cf. subviscida]|uniref:Nephrocystin 3-like N-terminal domain-containing protein n=1 Tax=Psilocybe cf. subviscida TaxID=2480587 RepID=A0A8H5BPP0_9AGAR|nr:hypothetical protein D9619_004603 [Psilocybe cf. subviscida]